MAITKTAFVILVILLPITSAARAETTVCDGSGCVVVSGGSARQMTAEEINRHYRQKSLDRLSDVDCAYAMDRKQCAEAKQTLINSFYR